MNKKGFFASALAVTMLTATGVSAAATDLDATSLKGNITSEIHTLAANAGYSIPAGAIMLEKHTENGGEITFLMQLADEDGAELNIFEGQLQVQVAIELDKAEWTVPADATIMQQVIADDVYAGEELIMQLVDAEDGSFLTIEQGEVTDTFEIDFGNLNLDTGSASAILDKIIAGQANDDRFEIDLGELGLDMGDLAGIFDSITAKPSVDDMFGVDLNTQGGSFNIDQSIQMFNKEIK